MHCIGACGATVAVNGVAWVIVEHWTDSRHSVVLAGSRRALCRIADRVGLPHADVVTVTPARSVLALSGMPLERYRAELQRPLGDVAMSIRHGAASSVYSE